MKDVCVSLISLLLIVSLRADEKNSTENLTDLNSEENNFKSSEKRWTQKTPFENAQPSLTGSSSIFGNGLVSRMIERAKEEKTLRDFIPMKTDLHGILIKVLRPKPIVDTASEFEKSAPAYGSGTEVLGDLVVKGSETLSKALLAALDVPKKALGKISSGATQALNQLGAFIVGL